MNFSYDALDANGRTVSGQIEAESEQQAIDRLQSMQYFPIRVTLPRANRFDPAALLAGLRGGVTEKDLMSFAYQMGVLLEAGFTLDRCLEVLRNLAEKPRMRDVLQALLTDIRAGKSLSDSLAKMDRIFPSVFANMVRAGEAGGFLEDAMLRLSSYLEETKRMKDEVRSALIYPSLLLTVGGLAIVVLLTFVVPRFASIFADIGKSLPLSTVILLAASGVLRAYWWAFLGGAGVVVFGMLRYLKSQKGRSWWDGARYRLPYLGTLCREINIARTARTLGALIQSGVPLLKALEIAKNLATGERLRAALAQTHDGVRKGRHVAELLAGSDVFPQVAIHMISVGEESGRLEEMLLKMAERFDLEVKNSIKSFLALLEPVLILFMGLVVSFIVISMLMAIFSLNELPL